MARRNAAQWAELVAKWKHSGLTAKKFGAREGIRPKSLAWWSWRLGKDSAKDESLETALPAFLPVHVVERGCAPKSATLLERHVDILVDGRNTVRVFPGFDDDTLRRVLGVLHEKATH